MEEELCSGVMRGGIVEQRGGIKDEDEDEIEVKTTTMVNKISTDRQVKTEVSVHSRK